MVALLSGPFLSLALSSFLLSFASVSLPFMAPPPTLGEDVGAVVVTLTVGDFATSGRELSVAERAETEGGEAAEEREVRVEDDLNFAESEES